MIKHDGTGRAGAPPRSSTRRVAALFVAMATLATLFQPDQPVASADEGAAEVFIGNGVVSLAAGGPTVYWSTFEGCPSGTELTLPCKVLGTAAAGDGTSVHAVFDNAGGSRDDDIESNIVSDEQYLYWVTKAGEAVRLARSAAPGTAPSVLAILEDATRGSEIAVDATHVYWTENRSHESGKLFRAPKDGGRRELMHENPESSLRQMEADGTGGVLFITTFFALVCCEDGIRRIASDAGGFTTTSIVSNLVDSFVVDDGSLYWITRFGRMSGGRKVPELRRAPLSNVVDHEVILTFTSLDDDQRWPALAADERGLLWQAGLRGSGPIFRLPPFSRSPEPISENFGQASELFTSGRHIFVQEGRRVRRLPADSSPVTTDLVADERAPEVVQVIQGADHDVKLVAGKRTFVRTYARIAEGSADTSELSVWPAPVLHGTRGGMPLAGSPLYASSDRLLDAPADRTTLDGGFLYELPSSWTQGTITLRSEVNQSRRLVEADLTNNSSERTVSFYQTRGICLDMLPVLTQAGVTNQLDASSHFARARSVFPTNRLYGVYRGGPIRTKPVTGDPYNMNETDDQGELLYHLLNEFMFSSPPSHCGADTTIRTVLVPQASRAGMANLAAPIIFARYRDAGVPVNAPIGGLNGLAHELGHLFGQNHVHCPTSGTNVPPGPYTALPYDSCALDATNDHIGLDALTMGLVVPFAPDGSASFSDFMSFNAPYWVSDTTYSGLLRRLRTGRRPSVPPASGVATSALTVSDDAPPVDEVLPASLVSGLIPSEGEPSIGFSYAVAGTDLGDVQTKIARGLRVRQRVRAALLRFRRDVARR